MFWTGLNKQVAPLGLKNRGGLLLQTDCSSGAKYKKQSAPLIMVEY